MQVNLSTGNCHLTCHQNFTWEYAKPGSIPFDPDFDKADDFDNVAIIQDSNQGVPFYVPKHGLNMI